MKILSLRLDKENNLHTSLAGLLYMIENEYLNDSATVIQQASNGQTVYIYFNDEEGIDLYPVDESKDLEEIEYDEDEAFLLTKENIKSHYIIQEGGYLPEFIEGTNIENRWLEPDEDSDMEEVLNSLFDDYDSDDVQFTIIMSEDDIPKTDEEVDGIMDFLIDLFDIEGEGKKDKKISKPYTIRDKAEEGIVERFNNKEYTEEEINILKEMEYGEYAGTTELEDILSAVKRILK